jgi:hypothetical protein
MKPIKAETVSTDGGTTPQMRTYDEKKIGKTLYCVTSVYKGEIDFAKAMEDLIVRKILRGEGSENPQKPLKTTI